MSYASREASVDQGNPVEWVKFAIGLDRAWRYTSSRTAIELDGETYDPIYLDRDAPIAAPMIQANTITLKLPRDAELPQLFQGNAPIQTVWVAYSRMHADDGEVIPYFQGRVAGIKWTGDVAEVHCDSLESMAKRAGLRTMCSPDCRFFLADGDCPVPEDAITTVATVSSVTGVTIVSADFATQPDHWFQFGSITTISGDSRMVLEHVGDTITLLAPFEVSPDGEDVTALAGCDFLPSTCHDKFGVWTDDGAAHGALNLIPLRNIFESGLN